MVNLEVAVPNCAAEDMGDEIVALNVETGIYFSMRDLAAALWRDLAGGFPVAELVQRVRTAAGTGEPVERFVGQMLQYGLMRKARVDSRVAKEPSIAALLDAGKHDVVLEVFEDMKDLILSDPIHDVDEAVGWPNRAPHTAG
jgi:hypothetical protein